MERVHSPNIPTATVSTPVVTIFRDSWTATVRGAPINAVSRILAVPLRRFDVATDGRLLTTREPVTFFTSVAEGTIATLSGLVPRLAERLTAAGYQVEVIDRRPCDPLEDADFSFRQVPALDGWTQQLCETVVREPRGQIIVDGQKQTADVIAQMLQLFPKRSICMVAKNSAKIRMLHRQLGRLTARKVTIDARTIWETKPRTLICLPRLASACRPEDFAIMMYADVESVIAKPTVKCDMQRGFDTRLYAILPRGQRLDAYQQLALEALTGPVVFDQGQAAGCLPKVHVWRAGPPTYPAEGGAHDPLQRKRTNLWYNQARNRLIAQLAHGITDTDTAMLRELDLKEVGDAVAQIEHNEPPCVVILVEGVEHARELKRLLHWPLHHAMPALGEATAEAIEPLRERRAIVTMLCATQWGLAADIVIRADGTASPWRPAWGPNVWLNRGPMLIVDVVDDFDALAVDDANRRHRDYCDSCFVTHCRA